MRRSIVALMLVPLATLALGVQPASAHASLHIVGFQYGYVDGFGVGVAGWVSGPVRLADGPTTDVLETVANHDLLDHTFTHCAAACDTITPTWGTLFDVPVPSQQYVDVSNVAIEGTVVFGCRLHPVMRGEITIFPS